MYHIHLYHPLFGVEGEQLFDGSLREAKRKVSTMLHSAGHLWIGVIRDESGDDIAVRYYNSSHWLHP